MGTFINRGNLEFSEYIADDYIDKTELIRAINDRMCKQGRYSCVTRCRRFGKSMAARMLYAYYDKSCNSRELFKGLKIESDPTFETHLNKYNVLFLDVTRFTTQPKYFGHIVKSIQTEMTAEIKTVFPQVNYKSDSDLMDCLDAIFQQTGERFFFIIDEWDAICREFPERRKYKNSTSDVEPTEMDEYVMFLRRLFKTDNSDQVFVGAYLTGILPMLKFQTESALNNFWEYSVIKPGKLAPYFGFTKQEVSELCANHDIDIEEMQKWYDGYQIGNEPCIFNPSSVMKATILGSFQSYWAATGSYDRIAAYIDLNFDGLKDGIIKMLAGEHCHVNTTSFNNNIYVVNTKDDVFTALIHLGYLAYDQNDETCYIPNKEVRDELINAVNANNWNEIVNVIQTSRELLEATIDGNAERVARYIDAAHNENTSILSYNDENSLSCTLSLAYIYARNEYILHRELATGKGFADLVFIPRKNVVKPAMIVELKYNKNANTAIEQIHHKEYASKVLEYINNDTSGFDYILLVGINYDKETKTHSCIIQKLHKDYYL